MRKRTHFTTVLDLITCSKELHPFVIIMARVQKTAALNLFRWEQAAGDILSQMGSESVAVSTVL